MKGQMMVHQLAEMNEVKIVAEIRPNQEAIKAWRKKMTVCREMTKACLESKESTPVEIRSTEVQKSVSP
jgi:hypothetical protein